MLKLFIANKNYSSWSLRPWVLLNELGIDFEERLVPFQGSATYEIFRRFSPNGKVPCLVDGDTVVWDSLAIVEYVAEDHPEVWPSDAVARAWARCVAAEMHSGFSTIRIMCGMSCGIRVRLNEFSPALMAEWLRIDELWRQGLSRFAGPFLAGRAFTAVDAFFAPVAFRVQTYRPQLSAAALSYADRLLDLRSMHEWYEAALQETWRDQAHDDEARTIGVWLEDLRAPETEKMR